MAFKQPYLEKIGKLESADLLAQTGGYHIYQTADAASVVSAAGYFNAGRKQLLVGDIISADCNGVWRHFKVTTIPADGVSNVTVTDMGSGGNVFIAGQAVTATASDTIATGLGVLTSCGASLDDAPVLTCDRATASKGDQAGAPVAGSILLKTWKPTAAGDATPIAATTFGKKANWWAFGKLA